MITTQLTFNQLTNLPEGLSAFDATTSSDTSIVLHLTYTENAPADQLVISGTGLAFSAGVLTSGTITSMEFKLADASIAKISDLTLTSNSVNDLLGNNKTFEHYLDHLDSQSASSGNGGQNDFGGQGDDDLVEGAGDDFVSAGAGNDHVDGGAGNDSIDGGAGDDAIAGGTGNDDVDGGVGNDNLDGGTGNDVLLGGEGDDDLIGGAGDDTLDGGAGLHDVANYTGDHKVNVDLSTGVAVGQGTDTLINIEDVDGSSKNDIIVGSDAANTLNGGAGNDNLSGGAGDDLLEGGDGKDLLAGGTGDDTLDGGAGNDVLSGGAGNNTLSGGDGKDTITSDDGNDTIDGGTGNDKIASGAGDDTVDGGEGDDTIVAGAGNDVINGGTGADKMTGGTGNDTYYVDNASDKVAEKAGEGTDTVISTVSYSIEKTAVENLTLSESASPLNIDATGNKEDNILIGNSGDNVLNGKAGADTLTGGAGNDLFVFSNKAKDGSDTVTDFHSGEDHLGFSGGVFKALATGITADNLVAGTAATTVDQHLIFDSNTGHLYYDADGSGSKEQVLIVTLTGVSALHAADFQVVA